MAANVKETSHLLLGVAGQLVHVAMTHCSLSCLPGAFSLAVSVSALVLLIIPPSLFPCFSLACLICLFNSEILTVDLSMVTVTHSSSRSRSVNAAAMDCIKLTVCLGV